MNQTRQIKHYLRQIKRLIPSECIGKKRVLETIQHRVEDYFIEHPSAHMSEFMQEFGTPEELAESFLDEMSGAELMTDLNRKRRKIVCTGCVLVSLAVLFAGYAVYVQRTTAVEITETITIYEDINNYEPPAEFEVQDPPKNEYEEIQSL